MIGHNGIDYGLPTGTPVVAATAGVAYVLSDPPGFGNYVQITGKDYKTIYAHLQKATVSNGAPVQEGQQIGVSNNTGNSSGPHLHFGVKPIVGLNNNNGFFGAIDPQPLLNQGTTTMPALDLARARVIAFGLLGRNGYDGRGNALNGDADADLNQNHVGKDPYEEIWAFYNSAEGQEWITKRLPAIYQRASGLATQAQSQANLIDSLNKELDVITAERDSALKDVEALQAKLNAGPPKGTTPNPTTPGTEPEQPTDAEVGGLLGRLVAWLKSKLNKDQ
jgi:hypothetical protein